ncbi:electron transfer flavoprotein subunit beta [Methylobacterium nodulans]|uniref:Electron transfer flavoprotein alpha/beta-subunit n=1 Tax=Methylobacterium nodulans (strain LMG 21967 / CNCM I-2342 / ORS 2060) TaxID=460265 RepID=B8IMD2_METNO|nr:electron transfer flavoprotein subunit beta [Methylobacterium nodulans]ACL58318.1 Electron transfer flavoprotein alpha/beta-subunit [Methylobacterium nodulans ORS 2060]
MKVAVLLSSGLHPVSGAPVVPKTEAQAIRMGQTLGEAYGLHAGPSADAVSDALGHGLAFVEHVETPRDADPVPFLIGRLSAAPPDVVLTGRRSQGGEETGLVPYVLARALSMTLVSDVVSVSSGATPGTLTVDQSLGRGALRRLVVRLPAVLTVHHDAPPALAFAFGRARRGRIQTIEAKPVPFLAHAPQQPLEERPYRRRPKILKGAPSGGSAGDRLKAATGNAGQSGGRVLIDPDPAEAAREIIAFLRQIGVLAPPAKDRAPP